MGEQNTRRKRNTPPGEMLRSQNSARKGEGRHRASAVRRDSSGAREFAPKGRALRKSGWRYTCRFESTRRPDAKNVGLRLRNCFPLMVFGIGALTADIVCDTHYESIPNAEARHLQPARSRRTSRRAQREQRQDLTSEQ